MFSTDKEAEVFEEVPEEPHAQEPVHEEPSATYEADSSVDRVDSIPGHVPQGTDESIEGRYAAVLFTVASKEQKLWHIYNDMEFLKALNDKVSFFKNTGLSVNDLRKLTDPFKSTAGLQDETVKFLEVLCENQRLTNLGSIATKYQKYYSSNREEKIRIISAHDLDSSEQGEVLSALKH